jgi:4-alpha-glucanotransferase
MQRRESGVLLHVPSLASPFGIGDLGPEAFRFVDFLSDGGQGCWQVLPLHPTDTAFGNSPYHSPSAFAFSPLLISPEELVREGLLEERDLASPPGGPADRVDYERVTAWKAPLLDKACEAFLGGPTAADYRRFCRASAGWLEDYAAFVAFKEHFGGRAWTDWPPEVRDREPGAVAALSRALGREIETERARQYLFFRQWSALRARCRERGVRIIGDMPIYVDHDSADVWSEPGIFQLDDRKMPVAVAGVPPDYFSETGQLWGNPLYRWDVLKAKEFDWWVRRMKHNLRLFDLVRIDHFRGLVGFWKVPAGDRTAANGKWVEAPARDLFGRLRRAFRPLPIIAEDLGTITPDVREVMDDLGFPGMKVLLFAFGEDNPDHPYLPHTYERNCVVYTGTHDNNTARGWFDLEARPEEKERLSRYVGRIVEGPSVAEELVRLALESPAALAVLPVQDLLGLGAEARMNKPSTMGGTWEWRVPPGALEPGLACRLNELTRGSKRA